MDSATLAHLLRCDLLPESWKADRETQARRQQVRLRTTLVRQRTRLKNQVHAVLHQQGLRSPATDLFGKRGRLWLAAVKLPEQARQSMDTCLRMLDCYTEEIEKQNLQLSEKAKRDERVGWLMTIPGIGEVSASKPGLKILCKRRSFFPMTDKQPKYPDISDILAKKASGRRQRAALSFSEKLDILDALRERVQPIVQARKIREEQRPKTTPGMSS